MDKILSISVAAYNVENFIKTNLDSFVKSNVRDMIEVIVTDDGSKDATISIVEEYEKNYPETIKLVKQKNSGPGSTVNSGIKHATGKYFRMVDGDDWVDTKNLEEYVEFLKNNDADMVITNYTLYDNETGKKEEVKIKDKETNTVLEFNKACKDFEFEMHNVTYKTEIFKKNNIILDNGFYTDVEYLLLPFPFVKTVMFLDINIYIYRIAMQSQSISMPSKQKNIAMHDIVLKRLIKYYEENKNLDKNILECMSNRITNMSMSELEVLLSFKPSKEKKEKVEDLLKFIKDTSPDIYIKSSKSKKFKYLSKNKNLYRLFSIIYRNKMK